MAIPLGQLLSSPVVQGLLGLASNRQYGRLQDQYETDITRQIADAQRIAGRVGPETLGIYDASATPQIMELLGLRNRQMRGAEGLLGAYRDREADIIGGYEDRAMGIARDYENRANRIIGGYRDRYNTAREELEGYGEQQRRDLDQYFDAAQEANLANLRERGIGSSTARTSGRTLLTERRGREQRRLGEDLQRFRRGILDTLSGQTLAAQMGLTGQTLGARTGLTGQGLAARTNLSADTLGARQYGQAIDALTSGNIANWYGGNAANRANIVGGGMNTFLNTLLNTNYMPPQPNPYPGQIGQNLVDPIDYSKGQSSSAPWIQAGGKALAAALLKAGSGWCIDGTATIERQDGIIPLRDIQVGDRVLCEDQDYHEVLNTDYGWAPASRIDDFVEIELDGIKLICTKDHIINDQAAGEWDNADHTAPVPCGDLKIRGDHRYVVNRIYLATSGFLRE